MTRTAAMSWDWREQPDLDQLARLLHDVSGGAGHLHQVDTGTDNYGIVLADQALNQGEADSAYRADLAT